MNTVERTNIPDFDISIGATYRHGITVVRIADVIGSNLLLQNVYSLDQRYLDIQSFTNEFLSGNLVPCGRLDVIRAVNEDPFLEDDNTRLLLSNLPLMSDAAKDAGLRIIKYITALQQIGYEKFRPHPLLALDIERLAKQFNDPSPPAAWTLYRHHRILKENDWDWKSIFPNFAARGGAGQMRLNSAAREVLFTEIEKIRSDPKAPVNFQKIWRTTQAELRSKNVEVAVWGSTISPSSVARAIKREIGGYELCVRNHGKKAAEKRYREWHLRDRAICPLEAAEFDDKDTRVFSIDDRNGLPNGRIYLTTGIDQDSATPLGFSIGDRPRSAWSAINAFVQSVLPNNVRAPEWSDVSSDCPYFGKLGIAIFDNALYNHAKQLETVVLEVSNSIMAWAKPYTPTEKSVIEDFNGRMAINFLPTLPGFAGQKHDKDRLSEGLIAANLSVMDFKRSFLKWAYDDYCHSPRAGGLTPAQKWAIGLEGRTIRAPGDLSRVALATTLAHPRPIKLRPEGVQFGNLVFASSFVWQLRKKYGHNAAVEIRFHPETADYIFVKDPVSGSWFKAESRQPEYTRNLTWAQHKLILKKARESCVKNPSIPQLIENRNALAKLVEQMRSSTKLKERKQANRIASSQTASYNLTGVEVTQVVTDLEYQVEEILLVDIEDGSEGWEMPEL